MDNILQNLHKSQTPNFFFQEGRVNSLATNATWPKIDSRVYPLKRPTGKIVLPWSVSREVDNIRPKIWAKQLEQVTHVDMITSWIAAVLILDLWAFE